MASGKFVIDFWEVGQGDCSVLTLPDGRFIFIDVGPATSPLIPWLKSRSNVAIHSIVITHNHEDHVGSLTPLLSDFSSKISTVYTLRDCANKDEKYKSLFRKLLEVSKLGVKVLRLEAPDIIWENSDLGISLRVEHPSYLHAEGASDSSSRNKFSGILSLYVNDKLEVVWPGDGCLKSIASLELNNPLLLMGPHHGGPQDSGDRLVKESVAQLSPSISYLSLGTNNSYNHPSKKYVSQLSLAGCSVYCSQITRQCDPYRARGKQPVLNGSALLGLRSPCGGVACRGALRLTLENGKLVPDKFCHTHSERVNDLKRPLCRPL